MDNETNLPATASANTELAQQSPAPNITMNTTGNGPQIGQVSGDANFNFNINVDSPEMLAAVAEMFKNMPTSLTVNQHPLPGTTASMTSHDAEEASSVPAQASSSTGSTTPTVSSGTANTPRIAPAAPATYISHALEWHSLNENRYNIFVLENEEYNCGAFSISKNRAISLYTHEDDVERFRYLDSDAVSLLLDMPCIFAKRNRYYNRTDSLHPAVLGKITAISNQGDTIKFEFRGFQAVPQQTLNEHVVELGIARAALRNEFDEEHWSIKRGNLQQILDALGIFIR